MGEKSRKNLYEAYVGESKASVRMRLFADIADKEELPQIGKLFRAISESETVHARNHLRLLGELNDTQSNLDASFEKESNLNEVVYPQMLKEAEEENDEKAIRVFSYSRDVEARHVEMYKKAQEHLISETLQEYHICQICGYLEENNPPDVCPVCGAKAKAFRKVE